MNRAEVAAIGRSGVPEVGSLAECGQRAQRSAGALPMQAGVGGNRPGAVEIRSKRKLEACYAQALRRSMRPLFHTPRMITHPVGIQ